MTQPGEPIVIDLARSRRIDRIIGWIVLIVFQSFLILVLVQLLRARAELRVEMDWFQQQRKAGRIVFFRGDPTGHPLILRVVIQFWLVFQIAAAIVFVGLLRRQKQRLTISSDDVVVETLFSLFRTSFASVDRLSFFQPARLRGLSGTYSIETRDGHTGLFEVARPDARSDAVADALATIESRANRNWIGASTEKRIGFRAFVGELRSATGTRSTLSLFGWLFRHAFYVRADSAGGVNFALLRWSMPFFALPFLGFTLLLETWMFFSPALIMKADYLDAASRGGDVLAIRQRLMDDFVVMPPGFLFIVAAGWISTCLGVNSMMMLLRLQERKREGLESELFAAREVQSKLLPASAPSVSGFELAASCVPARNVGGDYYDFIPLLDGGFAIPVADVSGKGLGAGLLMTLTKGALTSRLESGDDISTVLASVNRTIKGSSQANMFVSMVLARLSPTNRTVQILRAGHNPPLLVRSSGESRWIAPSGIALGLAKGAVFERSNKIEEVALGSGDLLILYSDGLTEAMNASVQEYGEDRLNGVVTSNRSCTAEEVKAAILDDVRNFRGGAEVNDDLTLVVIRAA